MASGDPIKFFRVVVGKDKIRVFREPGSADIPDCEVEVNDLQLWTTQVLVAMLREGRLIDEEEYKALGANLYKILFDNEIGTAIRKSYQDQFMRVELEFEKGQEALASCPWELLYCPDEYGMEASGQFLADLPKLILTRRIKLDGEPRPLRIDKAPAKILFVASGPKGREVEYDSVLEAIESLGPEMIEVTPLLDGRSDRKSPIATWDNFKDLIAINQFHAIHFLGHGEWDKIRKAGTILFMNKDNSAEDPRSESEVAKVLTGKKSLRLVFLQACESAQGDPYHAFSGAAQQLAQNGIPAVVGMQSKIDHTLANIFAKTFYQALANRLTVDAALQTARTEIRDHPSDPSQRLEFGLPVLYLRDSDSLFPPAGPAGTQTGPGISPAGPASTQTSPELVACPWCKELNKSTDNYCGNCAAEILCKKCNTRVDMKRRFCGACQKPLGQPAEISPPKGGDEFK